MSYTTPLCVVLCLILPHSVLYYVLYYPTLRCVQDEATFHLQHVGKAALTALGSKLAGMFMYSTNESKYSVHTVHTYVCDV